MNHILKLTLVASLSAGLFACGSDDSASLNTAKVSFSIADAPVDSAQQVNVSYSSITLQRPGEADIELLIEDENGDPISINLLDYQDGDSLLILSDAELPIGEYSELIINTYQCPQNQNGSTAFCNVVDQTSATLPLKTPSNKLRLGSFTVTSEGTQTYTIDFNLRKSLISTANGSSFNLKPHGVTIIDNTAVGSLSGTVDPNLFSAGECAADTGNVVYLYNAPIGETEILGDEFDPEIVEVPAEVVAPYASKMVQQDSETNEYVYSFSYLPAGNYLVAFSCSAVDDDPEIHEAINIADPQAQQATVNLEAGVNAQYNFVEVVEEAEAI